MQQNEEAALNLILTWEGPEVNISPGEPGGISKYGVSLQTYQQYNPGATANTIANLTANQASDFYQQHFLPQIRFDDLQSGVDIRLADIAINLGITGAIHTLQLVLQQYPLTDTISNTHIRLIDAMGVEEVIYGLSASWITRHNTDVAGWVKDGHGWSNRNNAVTLQAIHTATSNTPASALTDPRAKFPHDDTKSLIAFYGRPWEDHSLLTLVPVPFEMNFLGQLVTHITFHRKAAGALKQALDEIAEIAKTKPEVLKHVKNFSGSYDYRNVRGATNLSCHAFGAALDFDGANLPMTEKPQNPDEMPIEVYNAFRKAGFWWGGDFHGRRDPMHFQCASEFTPREFDTICK